MQVGYKLFYIFSFHSFRILDINFKKIFFISISIVVFFEIFIKLGCIFKSSRDTFYDSAHPYKLFRSQYFRCDGSFFIIIFHEFVIRFWVLMNSVTYCTSNAYQYQLVDWISLWSFFMAICHAKPGTERKWAVSSSYISRHIFRKLLNTLVNTKSRY